jgi:GTPase
MVEFLVCFGSDDESKENKRRKPIKHHYQNKQSKSFTSEEEKNIHFINREKLLQSPKLYNEELDYGNTEYKLKLINVDRNKLQKSITQMKFRLHEGNGECHYLIGVEDNGNPIGINEVEMKESIETIEKMVENCKNTKITNIDYLKGQKGFISEITIEGDKIFVNSDYT